MRRLPVNEAEFGQFMRELDDALIKRDLTPPWRTIVALGEIAKLAGQPVGPPSDGYVSSKDDYSPHAIAARALSWYEQQYGDKLKVFLGLGHIAVYMRGEVWLIKVPRVFGEWKILSTTDPQDPSFREGPTIDVVGLVESLPPALRAALDEEELAYLKRVFYTALTALDRLDRIRDRRFVPEVLTDLDTAAHHLLGPVFNPSAAHWASLQATEKAYKAFIAAKGGSIDRSHDLRKLAADAERLGLPVTQRFYLDRIQTSPSARYGDTTSDKVEAVQAYHFAFRVISEIARCIAGDEGAPGMIPEVN